MNYLLLPRLKKDAAAITAAASVLFVLPPGIEPGSQVPQTCILSVELREQMGSKMETRLHFLRMQLPQALFTGSKREATRKY